METVDKVVSHAKKHEKELIADLASYCEIPSSTRDPKAILKMGAVVEDRLKKLGADVKRVTLKNHAPPFILATLKAPKNSEKKKTVLIYNHYDVQSADAAAWDSDPFKLTQVNGKLFARGVADNKANMLLRIQAIETLLELTGDLPVNIRWLVEGEEEIGSAGMPEFSEAHSSYWKDCDVCIWETGGLAENDAPFLRLGSKGILYVELSCTFNNNDMHSGLASIADSPVWHLINAISTLRTPEGKVTLDGFYDDALDPTPEERAVMEVSNFDAASFMEEFGIERALESSSDNQKFMEQMYFRGSANICGIWAGFTDQGKIKAVLPNKAFAQLDFRLIPNQNPADILKKLRKHLDARGFFYIKVDQLIHLPTSKHDVTNPYIQKCLKVMTDVYKKQPKVMLISLGSGPNYYIAGRHKIPVVHIGAENASSNAHAPNENIRTADYFKGIETFTAYLYAI